MYEDFYDDERELDVPEEQKKYSSDEFPVDIGSWVSYMPYNDLEQNVSFS